jgi:predicted transcriptional regulator
MQRMMQCVQLRDRGLRRKEVATLLGISDETVKYWLKMANQRGFYYAHNS